MPRVLQLGLFMVAFGVLAAVGFLAPERVDSQGIDTGFDAETVDISDKFPDSLVEGESLVVDNIELPLEINALGVLFRGANLHIEGDSTTSSHEDGIVVFFRDGGEWVELPHDEFSSYEEFATGYREVTPRTTLDLKIEARADFSLDTVKIAAMNNADVPQASVAGPLFSVQQFNNSSPTIISRDQWGANPAYLDWQPQYAKVEKMVVHHTAGANGSSNPTGTVQGIYYYHAVSRGWGDIGYNYLIDVNGNIYEGRFGGQRVIGAHAQGYNTGSVGVSMMGEYNSQTPSSAALNSLKVLGGWVSARQGFNPKEADWWLGAYRPNVMGHRDVGQTACPGDNMYSQIPSVRTGAANHLKTYRTNRITGFDRYETAINVSKDMYPAATTADAVILVNAHSFAAGTTASSLAGYRDAPILLTPSWELHDDTANEIDRVLKNTGTVYIVGGTDVVPATADTQIQGMGYSVVRLDGANRFTTSFAVADAIPNSTSAMLVNGYNFPAGISAASPAANNLYPVLFTHQTHLTEATKNYITSNGITQVYIVGGEAAVSASVQNTLNAYGVAVKRFDGVNRYETAKLVSDWFYTYPEMAGLANGQGFVSGLVAGSYAGNYGMPLLLTPAEYLDASPRAYVNNTAGVIVSGRVFGATDVIPYGVAVDFDNQFPSSY